jgi:hypothetical protein
MHCGGSFGLVRTVQERILELLTERGPLTETELFAEISPEWDVEDIAAHTADMLRRGEIQRTAGEAGRLTRTSVS